MKKLLCLVLLTGSASLVRAACFGNLTVYNATASPCLVNALQPQVYPYRPQYPYSPHNLQVYPQHDFYGYRTDTQYPQQQQSPHVTFPQSRYPTDYNPYYRPNDISRLGYSYPAGYRGPQPEWQQPSPQYNTYPSYLGQPPSRYSLINGHPNLSPVPPIFQRRTYVANNQHDRSKEPIFMDRGTVSIVGRDAELSCSFYDSRFRVVSNAAWVKVTGPYEYGSAQPPFECHRPGCNYLYLNSYSDFRFRVITLGQTSTLRIYDYTPADQGIYRCAATAQGPDGQTVTIYKIIEFFSGLLNARPSFAGSAF